jgi:predicted MFS family arabinose efflux permease
MLVGIFILSGTLVAWALGARLSMLADLRFRGDVLVFGALAIQIAIFTPGGVTLSQENLELVHMATYLMLIGFVLLNLRVPGFWLLGLGVACNVAAIFSNSGQMPVSVTAWQSIGLDWNDMAHSNVAPAGPGTHLAWLGDIFAIPRVPHASVISVGDVLMVIGAMAFTYRSCTPRIARTSGMLAPMRVAAFRRVLAARFVSGVGDWLTQSAAVTWLYAETRSTTVVSVYLVLGIGAFVLGGLAAAPRLGRISGFRVLSLIELSRGTIGALMIPFALAGQIWPVIGLAAVSSLLSAATNPSASSLVPDVLPADQLQTGNALHQLSRTATMIFGAAGGGALVAQFGITTALTVDFLTFAVAAVLYRRFAARGAQAPDEAETGGASRRELGAAILRSPVVLGLTASFTVVTAAMGVLNSSVPALFDHRLGEPSAYGYAMAAIGLGYFSGEVITGSMQRQRVALRSISIAFVICAGSVYLLSYAQVPATAYLMLFFLGAADGTTEVVHDTLMQLNVTRRLRAGVFALADSIKTLGMVAGLAMAPLIERVYSTSGSLRVTAAGCLAGAFLGSIILFPRGARRSSEELIGVSSPAADPHEPAVAPAELDGPVPEFVLQRADAAEPLSIADLVAGGPVALVLLGDGHPTAEQRAMAIELAASGARVCIVSPTGPASNGHELEWLADESDRAFRAFGLDRASGAGPRSGVFVVDSQQVLRLAFVQEQGAGWLPAAVVRSRIARMARAA